MDKIDKNYINFQEFSNVTEIFVVIGHKTFQESCKIGGTLSAFA